MENVMQATMPHHGMGRPDAGGMPEGGGHGGMHAGESAAGHEHAGHGGEHASADAAPFRPLDPADPLYPCTVLDARYLNACYHMQTSAILFLNGGNFAATAATCDQAPLDYRHACYQSIGRDASAYTVQEHSEALRICSLGDPRFQPWCHLGYASNLVDLSARIEDGFAYCRLVPGPEAKDRCYWGMGQELWALGESEARRERVCADAEADFVRTCREGAGLRAAGPVGAAGAIGPGRPVGG